MTAKSRWVVDDEIPSMEADAGELLTTEDAELMWKRYLATQPRMVERFRHCMGCVHLRQAGGAYLVCCYLLQTGKKRPCVFGEACPVKRLWDGFKLPEGYAEWCAELDGREAKQKRKPGKRGREVTWDTVYVRNLYDRGFSLSEIVQITGIPNSTITGYASVHLWHLGEDGMKRRKNMPHATPEMILAEREAWLRHLAEGDEDNSGNSTG